MSARLVVCLLADVLLLVASSNASSTFDYLADNDAGSIVTIQPFELDCSLSFGIFIQGNTESALSDIVVSDTNLIQSVLNWTHLVLYELVESSFVYEPDLYTADLLHEYHLELVSTSTPSLSDEQHLLQVYIDVSVCIDVEQTEVRQYLSTELDTDRKEIAAYVKYELNDYVSGLYDISELSVTVVAAWTSTAMPLGSTSKDSQRDGSSLAVAFVLTLAIMVLCVGTVSLCRAKDNKLKEALRLDLHTVVSRWLQRVDSCVTTQTEQDVGCDSAMSRSSRTQTVTSLKSANEKVIITSGRVSEHATESTQIETPPPLANGHAHTSITPQPTSDASPEAPATPSILNVPLPASMSEPPSQFVNNSSRKWRSKEERLSCISQETQVSQVPDILLHHNHPDEEPSAVQSQICYQDVDRIKSFTIIPEDNLCDNLFSSVVID